MTSHAPPAAARLLLRLIPLGGRRGDIEDDLLELFQSRASSRSVRYARRRYCADVVSVWWNRDREPGLPEQGGAPRSWRFSAAEVVQDLTYAARLLRRGPALVLIAIAGLGLAIGVGTSIFSILNIIAFRSTGIRDSSGLATVMKAHRSGLGNAWSYGDYLQIRDNAQKLNVEAWLRDGVSFSTRSEGEGGRGAGVWLVSGGYLPMMNRRASSLHDRSQ
jgi:hypothetical protein